jgi:hypothetical protein
LELREDKEEYIDTFSDLPFSVAKDTDLTTLGVGAREGTGDVPRDVVMKMREGVKVLPLSGRVENAISSCWEIKTCDNVAQNISV